MPAARNTNRVADVRAPLEHVQEIGGLLERFRRGVNDDLAVVPARLNEDPYGEGWICVIAMSDASELDKLLDAAAYRSLIEG